ncbi:M15 family metallopeptidase [Laceyella putida]|uniref:D-alanyl-D-alanine carboxypeptidase family protein n=1 Tax=Laceyella putida TaxID=110101 RepID=A0ABW2RND3_9BACL
MQSGNKLTKMTAVVLGVTILLTGCTELLAASKQQSKEPTETVASNQTPVQRPTPEEKTAMPIPSNPASVAVLVNKQRALPADYEPADLVQPRVPFSSWGRDEKKLMRKEAARALEQLFDEADRQGIELVAVSGYRSYKRQQATYESALKRKGKASTVKYNALPGHSEHQTGLAMDVSSRSVGLRLVEAFAGTKEGEWLAAHAHEFGFIIRYAKGKEDVTGYGYEPWHIRYVGKKMAQEIKAKGIVLEEYYSGSQK